MAATAYNGNVNVTGRDRGSAIDAQGISLELMHIAPTGLPICTEFPTY